MMQLWKNGKNSNFIPNLEPLKLFSWILSLLIDNLPSMGFPEKLMNQISKNDKRPLWVLPLLVARHCSKLSYYAI